MSDDTNQEEIDRIYEASLRPFKRGCDDEDCCTSTGICGNLTFGKGELSPHGYWEHPCEECRAAYVEQFGTTDISDDNWPGNKRFEEANHDERI